MEPLSFDHKPTNDGECAILQVHILHLLIPIPRREGTDFECWWLCRIWPSKRFCLFPLFHSGYGTQRSLSGNLALSRALGDFEFKKNYSLSPQAQIITANPDVTCHEIREDDEFFVLACDGDFGSHCTHLLYFFLTVLF